MADARSGTSGVQLLGWRWCLLERFGLLGYHALKVAPLALGSILFFKYARVYLYLGSGYQPHSYGRIMLKARTEEKSFVVLLVAVSIAFIFLLLPFYSAVFWGTILAIIFQPVQRWVEVKLKGRRSLSAFVTLMMILLMVILPVIFLTGALVQQGAALYERMESGNINFGEYFEQIMTALPGPVQDLLARFGLADISSVQEQLSEGAQASQPVFGDQGLQCWSGYLPISDQLRNHALSAVLSSAGRSIGVSAYQARHSAG